MIFLSLAIMQKKVEGDSKQNNFTPQEPQKNNQSKGKGRVKSKQSGKGPIKAKQRLVNKSNPEPRTVDPFKIVSSSGTDTYGQQNTPPAPVQRQGSKVNKSSNNTPQGSSKFQEIATTMGQQHGVDTSPLKAKHNSPFPETLNAEATIQANKIDFAPGKDSEHNMRHEVAHYIDNTKYGTPQGDKIVNGYKVDTTRENRVDNMATSSTKEESQQKSNNFFSSEKTPNDHPIQLKESPYQSTFNKFYEEYRHFDDPYLYNYSSLSHVYAELYFTYGEMAVQNLQKNQESGLEKNKGELRPKNIDLYHKTASNNHDLLFKNTPIEDLKDFFDIAQIFLASVEKRYRTQDHFEKDEKQALESMIVNAGMWIGRISTRIAKYDEDKKTFANKLQGGKYETDNYLDKIEGDTVDERGFIIIKREENIEDLYDKFVATHNQYFNTAKKDRAGREEFVNKAEEYRMDASVEYNKILFIDKSYENDELKELFLKMEQMQKYLVEFQGLVSKQTTKIKVKELFKNGFEIYDNFYNIKSSLETLSGGEEALKENVLDDGNPFKLLADHLVPQNESIDYAIGHEFKDESVEKNGNTLRNWIKDAWDKIKSFLKGTWDGIQEKLPDLVDLLENLHKKVEKNVGWFIKKVGKSLPIIGPILELPVAIGNSLSRLLKYFRLKSGLKSLKSPDEKTTNAFEYSLQKLWTGFTRSMYDLSAVVVKFFTRLTTMLTGGTSAVVTESIGLTADLFRLSKSIALKGKGLYKWLAGTRGVNRRFHTLNMFDAVLQGDKNARIYFNSLLISSTDLELRAFSMALENHFKSNPQPQKMTREEFFERVFEQLPDKLKSNPKIKKKIKDKIQDKVLKGLANTLRTV